MPSRCPARPRRCCRSLPASTRSGWSTAQCTSARKAQSIIPPPSSVPTDLSSGAIARCSRSCPWSRAWRRAPFLVFDVPEVGRFGVLNCYDMWFPETSRQVTAMGAEVILHPVLTHTIDRDVDLAVAHATSAMMQCYVFDINGLGAGGNGHSAVFDPSGRALFRGDVCEQIIPIEIDLEQVRRQRKNGIRGLGQLAKSFRDRPREFPVYAQGFDCSYLDSLGPLQQPRRAQEQPDNVAPMPQRRSLV